MAVVALPVIVVSDAVVTWFKLAGGPLLSTITGWLILARWVALAIVAAATVAVIVLRRRRQFAAAESSLLALAALSIWVAVTAAMWREPPLQYFVPTSINEIFLGFDTPIAPTLSNVFTTWRPNLLFVTLAVVGSPSTSTRYGSCDSETRGRTDAPPPGSSAGSWPRE